MSLRDTSQSADDPSYGTCSSKEPSKPTHPRNEQKTLLQRMREISPEVYLREAREYADRGDIVYADYFLRRLPGSIYFCEEANKIRRMLAVPRARKAGELGMSKEAYPLLRTALNDSAGIRQVILITTTYIASAVTTALGSICVINLKKTECLPTPSPGLIEDLLQRESHHSP
ncbi:hypothetical protein JW826_04555 [Candidatus Woesearchaeota archaeon]|nr:hypothetical protein [Candidatus Woesearchaeota archaeon]